MKKTRKRQTVIEVLGVEGVDPGAVLINGRVYLYRTQPIPPDSGIARWVSISHDPFTNGPASSRTYHCTVAKTGNMECDCPDFVHRKKAESGTLCKHLSALWHAGAFDGASELVADASILLMLEDLEAESAANELLGE